MSPPTVTTCPRCGAVLPAGAPPADACPACGQPTDPDATWHPDPAVTPPAPVEMPTRLPLAWLALLATWCALMGLALGVWLGWHREAPSRRAEAPLPPLPAPGPALPRPMPAPHLYPARSAPPGAPPLPPARVSPPDLGRGDGAMGGRGDGRFGRSAGGATFVHPGYPSAGPPVSPSPRLPIAPVAPLKAPGMATVHVRNPSAAVVEVTLSGHGSQTGVVGPRAVVDLLVPPGRYDIALHGAARTQRFYDAPLTAGDVLELDYSDSTGDPPGKPARRE